MRTIQTWLIGLFLTGGCAANIFGQVSFSPSGSGSFPVSSPISISATNEGTPPSDPESEQCDCVDNNPYNWYATGNWKIDLTGGEGFSGSGSAGTVELQSPGSVTVNAAVKYEFACESGATKWVGGEGGNETYTFSSVAISGPSQTQVNVSNSYDVTASDGSNPPVNSWDAGGGDIQGSGPSVTITWDSPQTYTVTAGVTGYADLIRVVQVDNFVCTLDGPSTVTRWVAADYTVGTSDGSTANVTNWDAQDGVVSGSGDHRSIVWNDSSGDKTLTASVEGYGPVTKTVKVKEPEPLTVKIEGGLKLANVNQEMKFTADPSGGTGEGVKENYYYVWSISGSTKGDNTTDSEVTTAFGEGALGQPAQKVKVTVTDKLSGKTAEAECYVSIPKINAIKVDDTTDHDSYYAGSESSGGGTSRDIIAAVKANSVNSTLKVDVSPNNADVLNSLEWTNATQGVDKSTATVGRSSAGKTEVSVKVNGVNGISRKADIYVLWAKWITPSGDPEESPSASGDGQNEFSFDTSDKGELKITFKVELENISSPSEKVLQALNFEADTIGSSQMSWKSPDNENGKPSESQDHLVAELKFEGLPENNSDFGKKTANIKLQTHALSDEAAKYEVFFSAFATNHPEAELGTEPGSRNWYFYWRQTSAGDDYRKYKFDEHLAAAGSVRYAGGWRIRIGPTAAASGVRGWNYPSGIDFFAWVVRHEEKHFNQLVGFWGSNDRNDNDDRDEDLIPSNREHSYMPGRDYDPAIQSTFLDTIGYKANPLGGIYDHEDICMRKQSDGYGLDELWVDGSADSVDWANPGKQHLTKSSDD